MKPFIDSIVIADVNVPSANATSEVGLAEMLKRWILPEYDIRTFSVPVVVTVNILDVESYEIFDKFESTGTTGEYTRVIIDNPVGAFTLKLKLLEF
jgi:hypothetical protein